MDSRNVSVGKLLPLPINEANMHEVLLLQERQDAFGNVA